MIRNLNKFIINSTTKKNLLSKSISCNFSSSVYVDSHSLLSNKNKIKTSWTRAIVRENLPVTSDLITERGRSLDNLSFGVSYCIPRNYKDQIEIVNDPTDEKAPIKYNLPSKLIDDSWIEMILPFSTDSNLRDVFMKTDGLTMRYGKLFEILDAVAGDVSMRHCKELTQTIDKFFIATASVDAFDIRSNISMFHDLKLQGYLTYVGKSSMEVTIDILSEDNNGEKQFVGTTKYIMVARVGTKASVVFPLDLNNNEEAKKSFQLAERRTQARKFKASSSLEVTPPLSEEISILHNLHLKTKYLEYTNPNSPKKINQENDEFKPMKSTVFKNTIYMYPQNRNVHGNIFGGFIMKIAYELGWVAAAVFLGEKNVEFLYVDEIQFVKPVYVGSIVEFSSSVIYSENGYIVVRVVASDVTPVNSIKTMTNVLIYIFRTKDGSKAPEVLPNTYNETMLYLQGRRSLDETLRETHHND